MFNWLTTPLPVADWVESITQWFTQHFAGLFNIIQVGGEKIINGLNQLLLLFPPIFIIIIMAICAYFISKKRGLTLFTFLGLLYIYNQGIWEDLMSTLTLVLLASLISIIVGVPLGILMAKNNKAQSIITPILDFMQTMPGFVYLIPAVAFFGIGMVPGVLASVIFVLPPVVRFTNLGIRQVPKELIETSDSFGGTSWQKLTKLELPLAKQTILAGVNQTTMLALSMVVIASMIGAPGLGRGVLSALQRAQVGKGFVNGLAIVIIAIIMDRFTQYLNRPLSEQSSKASRQPLTKKAKKQRNLKIATAIGALLIALGLWGASNLSATTDKNQKNVNLSYVQWDTEVASTHVIAEVLTDMGYKVNLTPLDSAIMWQAVANGESDGMVAAWLPNTHRSQFEKYKNQLVDLGPNYTNAKVGLAVPSYMKVNSIDQLTTENKQKIIGIEPGAGVVKAAEKTVKEYPNLNEWKVETSSSGAMVVAVDKAIKNKEEIVFTGWTPHWMFSKYDLKYLQDPQGTMGQQEEIHTIVRKDLKKELPEVYQVLDQFYWSQKDIESVMTDIHNGEDPKKAAKKWVKAHPEEVNAWKKSIE